MRHGMSKRQRFKGLEEGYRSGLEETTAKDLAKRGVKFTYEETKIKWVDLKHRTYTPDFLLLNNGIIIETKGRFVSTDRRNADKLIPQEWIEETK